MLGKEISAEIPQETEDKLLLDLQGMRDSLPFLVELIKDERIRLAKLSRKNVDFVDRGFRYLQSHPQFKPPYLNVEEFAKDVALRDQLYRIYDEANSFTRMLKDTITVVEAEAYDAARTFYASIKVAATKNQEGAEAIANDLAYHYKKNRSTSEEKNTEENPPAAESQTA